MRTIGNVADDNTKRHTMAKRQRRTPDQQAERLQEQLAIVQKKAAIMAAKSNPVLLPLYEARGKFKTEIALQSRNVSDGPQSFASRRKNHQLWIDEIDALESYSKVAGDNAKNSVEILDQRITELSARISAGENITPEEIEAALEFDTTSAYDNAKYALDSAQTARKEFRASFDAAVDSEEMAAEGN
jgi:hypothetical protein